MCSYKVESDTNPAFVLYNLVFSVSRGEVIATPALVSQMNKYGTPMDTIAIEESLHQWYREGRLNERKDGYVLA